MTRRVTRRDIHEDLTIRGRSVEESDDKNANMAMDVPVEQDHERELAQAWMTSTVKNMTQKW